MGGTEVTLRHRLGTGSLEVYSPSGAELGSHAWPNRSRRHGAHRGPPGGLGIVVLAQFSTQRPCDRKANKPPGPAALAERARLVGGAGAEQT